MDRGQYFRVYQITPKSLTEEKSRILGETSLSWAKEIEVTEEKLVEGPFAPPMRANTLEYTR